MLSENTLCLILTSISNLVKKPLNRDWRHISNCYVIRERLHTTYNDPTETLQLNERSVTEGHCIVIPPVSRGTTRPDLEENAGKWAREVKPLMRLGKHSFDVCLPLPNVPATFGQHF